jgi:segregation and condensation protein B
MSEAYNSDKSKHGIALLTFEDTCQFCTKEAYAPYIREALGIRRGGNLSASSMEVLAVVAYNQPVTRSYVDLVRGVDSSYAVNSLLDKGLIEAAGRLDAPGRPMQYVTTDKFLRVFGLNSLAELPETEALSVAAAQVEEADAEQISMEIPEDAVPKEYTEPVDSEESNVIFEEADLQTGAEDATADADGEEDAEN